MTARTLGQVLLLLLLWVRVLSIKLGMAGLTRTQLHSELIAASILHDQFDNRIQGTLLSVGH